MKSFMSGSPEAPGAGEGLIVELCEKPELIITDWLTFVATSRQYCWIFPHSYFYIILIYFILIFSIQVHHRGFGVDEVDKLFR